eukprot:Nk52_evm28s628 gene=Nk52_evmTU28s628
MANVQYISSSLGSEEEEDEERKYSLESLSSETPQLTSRSLSPISSSPSAFHRQGKQQEQQQQQFPVGITSSPSASYTPSVFGRERDASAPPQHSSSSSPRARRREAGKLKGYLSNQERYDREGMGDEYKYPSVESSMVNNSSSYFNNDLNGSEGRPLPGLDEAYQRMDPPSSKLDPPGVFSSSRFHTATEAASSPVAQHEARRESFDSSMNSSINGPPSSRRSFHFRRRESTLSHMSSASEIPEDIPGGGSSGGRRSSSIGLAQDDMYGYSDDFESGASSPLQLSQQEYQQPQFCGKNDSNMWGSGPEQSFEASERMREQFQSSGSREFSPSRESSNVKSPEAAKMTQLLEVYGEHESRVRSHSPVGVTSANLRKRFSNPSSYSPSSSIQVQTSFRSPEFSAQHRPTAGSVDALSLDSELVKPEVFMSSSSYGGKSGKATRASQEHPFYEIANTGRSSEFGVYNSSTQQSVNASNNSIKAMQNLFTKRGPVYIDDNNGEDDYLNTTQESTVHSLPSRTAGKSSADFKGSGNFSGQEERNVNIGSLYEEVASLKSDNQDLRKRLGSADSYIKALEAKAKEKGDKENKAAQSTSEAQTDFQEKRQGGEKTLEVHELTNKNMELNAEINRYKDELDRLKAYVGDKLPQKLLDERQSTYKIHSLESENASLKKDTELLKVRIEALNSIMDTQTAIFKKNSQKSETVYNDSEQENINPNIAEQKGGNKYEDSTNVLRNELLSCWRNKAFSLLVQLKSHAIIKKEDDFTEQRLLKEHKAMLNSLRDKLAIAKHRYNDKCAEFELQSSALRVAQLEISELKDRHSKIMKLRHEESFTIQNCELKLNVFKDTYEQQSDKLRAKLGQMELLSQRLDFALGRMKIMKSLFERNNNIWKEKYTKLQESYLKKEQEAESKEKGGHGKHEKPDGGHFDTMADQSRMTLQSAKKILSAVLEKPEAFGHEYYAKLFKQLMSELTNVSRERDYLNETNKDLSQNMTEKVASVRKEYEIRVAEVGEKLKSKHKEVLQLKEDLEDSVSKYEFLVKEHEETEELVSTQREKCNALRQELAKSKRELEKSSREQLRKFRDEADEEYRKLENSYSTLKKEHAKVAVSLSQMERQLSKQKVEFDLETREKVEDLEMNLLKAEKQLESVVQERNTLLVAIREQGRKSDSFFEKSHAEHSERVSPAKEQNENVHLQSQSDDICTNRSPFQHRSNEPEEYPSFVAISPQKSKVSNMESSFEENQTYSPHRSPRGSANARQKSPFKGYQLSATNTKKDVKQTLEELKKLSSILLDE